MRKPSIVHALARCLLAVVTLMTSGIAYAQNSGVPALWSGFYVGSTGGYGWGQASHASAVLPVAPPVVVELDDGRYTPRGGMLGATVGYNFFSGHTLLGIEADYSAAWIDGDADCSGNHCGGKLRGFGTVRGRVGYDMGPVVAYASGGLAFADFKAFTDNAPGYSGADERIGWAIGGGLDRAITSNLSLKLEYLYADFGTRSQYTIDGHTPERIELSTSVVRVGLNLKLGG